MAEIRLNKLVRQYNIGLSDLVDFLHKQGADVEENPNAKVSDEFLPALDKQFGKDLEMKEAAEKVDIKMAEILEKSERQGRPDRATKPEEEEEPERETIIKSNIFSGSRKETSEPVAAEPEQETPAPEPAAPVAPETPEVEAASEPEPAPVAPVQEIVEEVAAPVEEKAEEPVEEPAAPVAPETPEAAAE
ncbi:MAG: hypothetical protein J5764_01060, partial [Bacteroidales bacterium]|nr:hypothetical protein [Bacteroidales bacterium]